jgi:hypothetical protein
MDDNVSKGVNPFGAAGPSASWASWEVRPLMVCCEALDPPPWSRRRLSWPRAMRRRRHRAAQLRGRLPAACPTPPSALSAAA